MGSSFVTIDGEHGFWMRDSVLELWLRLLALESGVLNLLGIEGGRRISDLGRDKLLEVGAASIDLMEGRITSTASSTEFMPGT